MGYSAVNINFLWTFFPHIALEGIDKNSFFVISWMTVVFLLKLNQLGLIYMISNFNKILYGQ